MASEILRLSARRASFCVFPSCLLAQVVGPARSVVADLGDGHHIDGMVDLAVAFEVDAMEGTPTLPASAGAVALYRGCGGHGRLALTLRLGEAAIGGDQSGELVYGEPTPLQPSTAHALGRHRRAKARSSRNPAAVFGNCWRASTSPLTFTTTTAFIRL